MAIKLEGGVSANQAEVNSTLKALRTASYPTECLGSYRIGAMSGLLSGVAAGAATAGHLFALRNTHATTLLILTYLSIKMRIITSFTAAQEFGFEVFRATSYSASHTTGTQINPAAAGGFKKRSSMPSSVVGDARISTTAALTAGTHTLDAQPMLQETGWELVAGATVPKARIESIWDNSDGSEYPLVLAQNEGLIIRNGPIALGAGGTARLLVDMEWVEANAYP